MNKYREGKVQSTLERELNVLETVVMQAYGTCAWLEDWVCLGESGGDTAPSVGFSVVSNPKMCLSSSGVCQHGFGRGLLLGVVVPSGRTHQRALLLDWHL